MTDSNVIEFPKPAPAPEPLFFHCSCGCAAFLISDDQWVQCLECEDIYNIWNET